MPKLIIKKMICHKQEDFLDGDEIQLSLWGRQAKRVVFEKEGVKSGHTIMLNDLSVEFNEKALIMLIEKDRPYDSDDLLTSAPVAIPSTVKINGSIPCGTSAKYELIYDVVQHEPLLKSIQSVAGNLVLKSLICVETEDDSGPDEARLEVWQRGELVTKYERSINTGELVDINCTISVDNIVHIKLIEKDNGKSILDMDDQLGCSNTLVEYTSNEIITFRGKKALYYLIYDICPIPTAKRHDLYVVPKQIDDGHHNAEVWIGSFSGQPYNVTWKLVESNQREEQAPPHQVTTWEQVQLPYGQAHLYCQTVTFNTVQLKANACYRFIVSEDGYKTEAGFRTLPQSIPVGADHAFTVFLGSCFEPEFDYGRVTAAYANLFDRQNYPHINFLVGDQVYLDHPMTQYRTTRFSPEELQRQFLYKYLRNWTILRAIMSRAINYFIPDDHEIYNNYPFRPLQGHDTLELGSSPLRDDGYLAQWVSIAKPLCYKIQSTYRVRTFKVGNELSFFIADTTTKRERKEKEGHILPPEEFQALIQWVTSLNCTGVLVIAAPLLLPQEKYGNNSLYKDYRMLVEAIATPYHDYDIVVLSGDQHFSRFAQVRLAGKVRTDRRLYEVVSSPMSLIELDPEQPSGITTDVIKYAASARWVCDQHKKETFPPDFIQTHQQRYPIEYLRAGGARYIQDGCYLHMMSYFPKDLTSYKTSYILIESKNELYYIKPDGTIEEVTIQDFSIFNQEVAKIFSGKIDKSLLLSSQQIKDLITLNGGHTLQDSSARDENSTEENFARIQFFKKGPRQAVTMKVEAYMPRRQAKDGTPEKAWKNDVEVDLSPTTIRSELTTAASKEPTPYEERRREAEENRRRDRGSHFKLG